MVKVEQWYCPQRIPNFPLLFIGCRWVHLIAGDEEGTMACLVLERIWK